jgi:acyl-CoA thioesterase-2
VTEWMSNDPKRRDEWLREWSVLDLRLARREPGRGQEDSYTGPVDVAYWIRVKGRLPDEQLVHRAALTYLSDMTLLGATLVKHKVHPSHPGVQAASLDHTVWFHHDFRADEWLLYTQTSPIATGARGLALGHLFTEDGLMVASVSQEGLIRPRREG